MLLVSVALLAALAPAARAADVISGTVTDLSDPPSRSRAPS